MTDNEDLREWSSPSFGFEIRAILVRDMPYRASSDSGLEVADLWFMFISISGNDSWVGYAVVDSLEDEPRGGLEELDITQLKKHSIILGDRWEKIKDAPAATAQRHQSLSSDIEVVNDEIMKKSLMELQEHRDMIDWESTVRHWQKLPMILSLN